MHMKSDFKAENKYNVLFKTQDVVFKCRNFSGELQH